MGEGQRRARTLLSMQTGKKKRLDEIPAVALIQGDADGIDDDSIDGSIDGSMHRPDLPERTWAGALLFKVCIVLGIIFPIAVIIILVRSVVVMSTGEDTGSTVWSPPGSTTVPAIVTLIILILGLIGGAVYFARRRWDAETRRRVALRAAGLKPRARVDDDF